jgi:hypothetical protein
MISLATPALLFPAISLLMLAYTNRFLAIANLVRNLKSKYIETHEDALLAQIYNLRRRLYLIRNMQIMGVVCIMLCVLSMFSIYLDEIAFGALFFGLSLVALLLSLIFSLRELNISVVALDLELRDIERETLND